MKQRSGVTSPSSLTDNLTCRCVGGEGRRGKGGGSLRTHRGPLIQAISEGRETAADIWPSTWTPLPPVALISRDGVRRFCGKMIKPCEEIGITIRKMEGGCHRFVCGRGACWGGAKLCFCGQEGCG